MHVAMPFPHAPTDPDWQRFLDDLRHELWEEPAPVDQPALVSRPLAEDRQ